MEKRVLLTTTIEQDLLRLERAFWDSIVSKDSAVASRLTAERSLVTDAQGVTEVSRQTIGPMLQAGGWTLKRYEFSDVTVLTPAADTVVIAHHVHEELEVDGQALTLEANDASTRVRQGGN